MKDILKIIIFIVFGIAILCIPTNIVADTDNLKSPMQINVKATKEDLNYIIDWIIENPNRGTDSPAQFGTIQRWMYKEEDVTEFQYRYLWERHSIGVIFIKMKVNQRFSFIRFPIFGSRKQLKGGVINENN